jgi:anti-anti-sigma factor
VSLAYLPPRPKQQPIRRVLARLRSVVLRKPVPGCRSSAPDSPAPGRMPCGVHPIGAAGASRSGDGAAPGTLRIHSRRARDQHLIELSGELNVRTRGPVEDAIERALEENSTGIVLDLSGVVAIDYAGLGTVLTAHLRASDELKPLVIVPGPPAVQRVFGDAQVPFTYVAGRGNRGAGAARARGRRAAASPRSGRGAMLPHRTRHSR